MGATRSTRLAMIAAASLLVLPAFAGTALAAPASVPTPGSVCEDLFDQRAALFERSQALAAAIEDTPAGPLLAPLQAQFADVQAQIEDVADQLEELACSSLPGGGSGGSGTASSGSGDDGGTPAYGSGHTTYVYEESDDSAEVVATQVDTVPVDGVATGDGSLGG